MRDLGRRRFWVERGTYEKVTSFSFTDTESMNKNLPGEKKQFDETALRSMAVATGKVLPFVFQVLQRIATNVKKVENGKTTGIRGLSNHLTRKEDLEMGRNPCQFSKLGTKKNIFISVKARVLPNDLWYRKREENTCQVAVSADCRHHKIIQHPRTFSIG